MIVSHGTCIYIIPAPSMNKNISNIKYSHHMRSYMSHILRYIDQYGAYTSNRSNRHNMSNMSIMSNMINMIKLNKDKFFYKFIEDPAPTCQKLEMEK
jgi:hypothetical protein